MPSSAAVRLILVRHGRTEFNAQGRVQGGGRLDAVGRAQVTALAHRMSSEPLSVIYSSTLTRALQTARAIARHHPLPIRLRQVLRDLDFGVHAGASLSEARAQDPDLWRQWREAPQTVRFSGGESLADLRRRMERFLNEARRWWRGRTILAATHDSPIRTLCCIVQGLDDSHHHDWVASVASVTILDLTPDSAQLLLQGDTQHLGSVDGD